MIVFGDLEDLQCLVCHSVGRADIRILSAVDQVKKGRFLLSRTARTTGPSASPRRVPCQA